MVQVTGRGLQRRQPGHLFGRAPGQDGRRAVHARVRQPALGTGHQARRHGRAQITRPAAIDGGRLRIGAQCRPGLLPGIAELAGRRLVARRRQQHLGSDLASRDTLRHGQQGDVGRRAAHGHMRHHGVAGAQVDAHDVGGVGSEGGGGGGGGSIRHIGSHTGHGARPGPGLPPGRATLHRPARRTPPSSVRHHPRARR